MSDWLSEQMKDPEFRAGFFAEDAKMAREDLEEARQEITRLHQKAEDYLRRITSMTADLGEAMREAARLRGENEQLRDHPESG